LLLGSAGGLLIWAVLAQRKVSKLRSKYAPITSAEEEAERIRKRSSVLQEQSKKTADSIVAKGQAKLQHLEREAESVRKSISSFEMKREEAQNELDFINQTIALKNDDIHLLEVGYFEAGYEFDDLPAYEAALRRIREEQKQMLRMDGSEGDRSAAAFCSETIRFNDSVSQGRSMIKKILDYA
jgi:septal ring factor EnvC (AmiA/AmiB activator)